MEESITDVSDLTRIDHRQKHVVLPFTEGDFNKFVKGLLGRPQEITKEFFLPYDLEMHVVINAYHLLNQRIHQQNEASTIDFTAKIWFDDDSSVSLNGIDSLSTYNEIKPVCSSGLLASWVFLVRFQDKKVPEKQQVDILFKNQRIQISIKHTARSWGADIEALLSNYLRNILIPESPIKAFARQHEGIIGGVVGVLIFLGAMGGAYVSTWRQAKSNLQLVSDFLKSQAGQSSEALHAKLNFVTTSIANGSWGQHYFSIFTYLLIGFVLAVILGTVVGNIVPRKRESFMLLTPKDKQYREQTLKSYTKRWQLYVFSLVLSLLCGVISNYLFMWISSGSVF